MWILHVKNGVLRGKGADCLICQVSGTRPLLYHFRLRWMAEEIGHPTLNDTHFKLCDSVIGVCEEGKWVGGLVMGRGRRRRIEKGGGKEGLEIWRTV